MPATLRLAVHAGCVPAARCVLSLTMRPSCRRMVLWAWSATTDSCVIRTMVCPSAWSRAEGLEDDLPGLGVQVPGGLVGQDEGRVVDQGPGDGHALYLAPGQLIGEVRPV